MQLPDNAVQRYHDGTKHHFSRFARSLGYLDWAAQPRPFRTFAGAERIPLGAGARADPRAPAICYDELFLAGRPAAPFTRGTVADVFRHALGLSAWKQYGTSRWALRVNPSSGNLHPTEAHVLAAGLDGLGDGVYHYSAEDHAFEQRASLDAAGAAACGAGPLVLVALTSIHWREAWKYGERAFRYCQHDVGHAMAALGFAAALNGWRAVTLPAWSQQEIAALVGLDRDEDFGDAEREDPACLLALTAGPVPAAATARDALLHFARSARWTGCASPASEHHVAWPAIDEIARATVDPGRDMPIPPPSQVHPMDAPASRPIDARALLLQRRSAQAFDPRGRMEAAAFFAMLERTQPGPSAPWAAIWWPPRVHLLIFVHGVDGLDPGLYLCGREPAGLDRLMAACGREFLHERAHPSLPLVRLARGNGRAMSRRLSCDQDIAADGCFSLGMLAEFEASLDAYGPSFYRQLYWECGVVGQVLYLEAEAAGLRGTGIGCFYDDPVHDVLGLHGHGFQSLYHFTIGHPIEDRRLTTEPGYAWERSGQPVCL